MARGPHTEPFLDRGFRGLGKGKMPSSLLRQDGFGGRVRGLRVIRGLILFVALVCSLQFASSAKAQTPLTSPGLDGLDCITAIDPDDAPLQICEDSSDLPNDFDEISLPLNDRAVLPSRYDQGTPQTTGTTFATITLRQPGIVPAFLLSTQSSDSLREHLRERAPPLA